jgi:hypothetical protein
MYISKGLLFIRLKVKVKLHISVNKRYVQYIIKQKLSNCMISLRKKWKIFSWLVIPKKTHGSESGNCTVVKESR